MNYLDFEIEISPGAGREYPIAIVRSPAGEARETMKFPFDELALKDRLQNLQIALLRSGGKRRSFLSAEGQTAQEFGQKLFDALLTGEMRSRYDVNQREAAQKGLGLRFKLRIQSPELAALPWEFLYDARQAKITPILSQKKNHDRTTKEMIDMAPEPNDDLRQISRGSFWMGSNDGQMDERPVHEVYVDGFYKETLKRLRQMQRNKPLQFAA